MDFELERSVLPSRLNVPPPPPVMHFEKPIYFSFLNQLVYPMMTSFFQNDMAFGKTDDIIIFQLASLYHNRLTLF